MTWHETIEYIRTSPEYVGTVKYAYMDADLKANLKLYKESNEFSATVEIIKGYFQKTSGLRILDLGAGNGISSLAFAQLGNSVVSVEPDPSDTIGCGAIEIMKQELGLKNLEIFNGFGEELPYPSESFDLVFGRQVMHHAYNLQAFVNTAAKILKQGGVFFTVRDHVISNEHEKEKFLINHPLHKFYGGENAFTLQEYKTAIGSAGLEIKYEYAPDANALNTDPWSETYIEEYIVNKIGIIGKMNPIKVIAKIFLYRHLRTMPGRLYSFFAIKK